MISASAFLAAASVTPMDVPSGMRISMKSSGRDEVGKNCCCTCVNAPMAEPKAPKVRAITIQRRRTLQLDGAPKSSVKPRIVDIVRTVRLGVFGIIGKQLDADVGVKNTATTHDTTSARPTIQKMLPAYSPAVDFARPTGRKPAAVTSVPVSMGNAVEIPGGGGGLNPGPALLHSHHHHLDGDDGVVNEQAERDDKRAERDAVEV